ncbi:MAG TPA: hypothetical protein VHO72_08700 [Bacteroidales bacterium]|nr:hypothetical protein [Bacteroidales bacterium]
MSKYVVSFILVCLAFITKAQTIEDVIYLKNGSILRGQIVDHTTDSVVRIMVTNGKVWDLPASDIASFSKEKPVRKHQRFLPKEKGFNTIIQTGVFFPLSGEKSSYFHAGLIGTWRVWPCFFLGVGANIDRDSRTYCPIYADARYYVNRKYFAPYISLSCGKALAWDKDVTIGWRNMRNYGDLYFATSLGVEFPKNENLSFLLSIEYKYQRNHLKTTPPDEYYELIEENNRIGVKLGLLFK